MCGGGGIIGLVLLHGQCTVDLTSFVEVVGEKDTMTVKQFLEGYFGYRHDFLGVVAMVLESNP